MGLADGLESLLATAYALDYEIRNLLLPPVVNLVCRVTGDVRMLSFPPLI